MALDKTIRARLTYAAITALLALAVVGVQARILSEIDSRYVRREEFNTHVAVEAKQDESVTRVVDEWFKVAIGNRESLRVIETDVKYLRQTVDKMTP